VAPITLRGETTKRRRTRLVPIATARLRAVLEWLQLDANREKKPADVLVFSDESGEPVGRFRTAWVTAVLKANAVAPVWKSYNWTALIPDCHAEIENLQAAAARLERGETFDPSPREPVAPSICQVFRQEFGRSGAGRGRRSRPRDDH
jgi:hypothetical protein